MVRLQGKTATCRPCQGRHIARHGRSASSGCRASRSVRKCEDEQAAAKIRVLGEVLVSAHGAESLRRFCQTCGHADARPATDAGEDADILLAVVLVREHV